MTAIEAAERPRIGGGTALLLFIVGFIALYWPIHMLRVGLEPTFHPHTLRDRAGYELAMSIALVWATTGMTLLILRLRGQRLSDLGWRKPASLAGWAGALAVIAIYAGFARFGFLKNAPMLSDWSLFRIAAALGVGITAGFGEEVMFRGFVMTQARDAGLPTWLQVVLAAVLFGMAHGGWGALGSHFDLGGAIGATVSTAILGAVLAGVYLLGRRSLMPVVFAHAMIDLIIEPWLILFALSGGFTHPH